MRTGISYSPPSPERQAHPVAWKREVIPLLDRLSAEQTAVATASIAVIRKALPSYQAVPEEELRSSSLRNVRNVIGTLSKRRLPGERELAAAAVAASDRARQGVPMRDALTAYRISVQHIREHLSRSATQTGVASDITLEMLQFVWALADAVSVRMASSHADAEVEIARHDERQRAEFLRGLVSGSLGVAEIRRLGPAYNLALDRRYLALRGRPAPDTGVAGLLRVISAWAQSAGQSAFVDTLGGEVVGVVSTVPDLRSCPGVIGVGPPADLAAIEPSFATASRVLAVAGRFGRTGVVTLEDLSVLVAVAAEDELGELLMRRYLGPLEALGGFGDSVRHTVEVFLDHDLNYKTTGRALGVHPNTVRLRTERFEELTGVRLDHLESAVEVWWALRRARLHRQSDRDPAI